MLCRNLNLFSQSIIAIDGSKFKAVNNRDRNFTQGQVKARMQQIEQSIDRYLAAMDSADRATPEVVEGGSRPRLLQGAGNPYLRAGGHHHLRTEAPALGVQKRKRTLSIVQMLFQE